MNLPKTYNPKTVEGKIYQLWQKSGFFNPDKLPKQHKKPYTIVIPPPNITGELHMGHALNAIIQDILIRWKRMQGFKALWLPGTDHAGIATQNVVEKKLKKEGLTRFDLGRKKFIKEIWKWKRKYGDIILNQFKKLGCSCDWSRTRFTMDNDYSLAVKEAFLHYYKKGWVYRGKRVVNWCPHCLTSLSDLELEYKEEKGKLWYIRYLLSNVKYQMSNVKSVVVATTRPETMLGDTAVAVNPKDDRYKNLIGKKVSLPLANREIPIIADRLVDPEFGTGAVKITPAHDLKDYEMALRHSLEIIQVINEKGEITKEAPLPYQGSKVIDAREKVIEDLKNQGLLEKIEDYTYQIPKCYRCNTTIEFIPSWQWFLKMKDLAKIAETLVKKGKIKFHPKNFKKPYLDWLKNIKDWCISRQIWWGHTLPIWYCQIGKKSKLNNNEYFLSLETPKKCPICGKCRSKQINDVLDTWFSSALWPFAALGWSKNTKDLKIFYPTDVLVTARDIINLWVARMIFSGKEFMKKPPFKDVYVHATVLTREGERMSKSLGTGIDPIKLIDEYGADATRFGIAYQIMENQDIRFITDNILMGKKFCNKMWNASRFVLMSKPTRICTNLDSLRSPGEFRRIKNLTSADKKILNILEKVIKSVNKDLKNFQFGKATHTLYDFFWHDFCDRYIEEFKIQNAPCRPGILGKRGANTESKVNPESKSSARYKTRSQLVLLYVLLTSLKLLHPFIPFITEEIYQKLPIYPPKFSFRKFWRVKNKKKCLMAEKWPT